MDDEWGPWIIWCGGPGCPVPVGTWIQVDEFVHGAVSRRQFRVTQKIFRSPCWKTTTPFGPYSMIQQYRVRIPRGLAGLRGFLTDTHQPVAA